MLCISYLCPLPPVFSLWRKIHCSYNSSYMYLASVFENRPQESKRESFFSIDVLIFPYVVFLLFYYPPWR